MKTLRLHCRKCLHTWDYKGKMREGQYASCPACKFNIKIQKAERGMEGTEGNGNQNDTDK